MEFTTGFLTWVSLAIGVPILLPLVPLAAIGRRFFILMSLLAVVFVALAIGAVGLGIDALYLVFAGLLIAYNLVLPRQSLVDWSERRESLEGGPRPALTIVANLMLLAAIAVGVAALVRTAWSYPVDLRFEGSPKLALSVSFLSAALLVGGSLDAMVLGHWYLVARNLSFSPLARMCGVLIAVLFVRCAVIAYCIWAQAEVWSESFQQGVATFFTGAGLFVLVRVVFGLVLPAVLLWMAWRCIRIKSNQSATGILYVAVAFILIGEIVAKYLLVSQRLVL